MQNNKIDKVNSVPIVSAFHAAQQPSAQLNRHLMPSGREAQTRISLSNLSFNQAAKNNTPLVFNGENRININSKGVRRILLDELFPTFSATVHSKE